jgi:ATP-binding cassette subfamily G (WHITE) protein 2 (PDR)
LAGSNIYYSERWRNFGIMFAFIGFNVFLALLTYWLFRVVNLSNFTAKFHKTKKGAKVKGTAEKAADGVSEAARQGANPGNRSGEKDTA